MAQQMAVEMGQYGLGAVADAVALVEYLRCPLDGRRMDFVLLFLRELAGLLEQIALGLFPRAQRVEQRSVAVENESRCVLK